MSITQPTTSSILSDDDDFLSKEAEKIKIKRETENIFELEEIETIQILIQSNIPETPIFPFTKYMLYSPLLEEEIPNIDTKKNEEEMIPNGSTSKIDFSKLSEYPYFTNEIKYPKEKLILLEYHSILKFFFNKEEFQTLLQELLPTNTVTNGINHENNEYNVMTMIELLFPTVAPYKNNFNTSINEYVNHISYTTGTMFPTNNYTFIRYNYKIYTITKITWLNDILNHPLYKLLIKKFANFKKWAMVENTKIEKAFVENQDKIRKIINKLDYEPDIERLQTYIERLNISLNNTKETRFSTEFSFTQKETAEDLINIFEIFKIYQDYIKNNYDFSNFYNDVKLLLLRYKPKVNENVEVKIGNYWYNAKIFKINPENNTYDLKIFTYNPRTKNTVELVTLTEYEITDIRKPLLKTFLKKENNIQFNFEISTILRNDSYVNTNNFLSNYWKENKNSPLIETPLIETPLLDTPLTDTSIREPIEKKGTIIGKIITYNYVDFHKMDNIEKNDLNKRHYRISDYFKITEDIKSVDEILNEELETLKIIFSKDILRMQISTNLKSNLDKCIQFYKRLDTIQKIQNEYLNDLKVDVTTKIDTEFQEYLDFINQIKKYIGPKLMSMNPKLQTIIDNYANNIDSKSFINLMNLSAPCISSISPNCDVIKNPKFTEIINTNLNVLHTEEKNTKYTIFLHMDFVEGQLDRAAAENKGVLSKLNCLYKDELLTKQFNNLAYKKSSNTWIVQPAPFIQVEIPKEITVPQEETESINQAPWQLPPPPSGPENPYMFGRPPLEQNVYQPTYPPPVQNPFFNNQNAIPNPNIIKRYNEPYIPPLQENRGGRNTLKNQKRKKRMTRYANRG